jgi:hypothetical protein
VPAPHVGKNAVTRHQATDCESGTISALSRAIPYSKHLVIYYVVSYIQRDI